MASYSSYVFSNDAGFKYNIDGMHCGVSTESSVENAVNFMGYMRSSRNNPYEHLLMLNTEAKNIGRECTVVVNLKLRLSEYRLGQRVRDNASERIDYCSENASLLGTPENLQNLLYEFIYRKIESCVRQRDD